METKKSWIDKTKSLLLKDRYGKIINNDFFIEEFDFVCSNEKILKYYIHLIENINFEKNTKNSFILWASGKVNDIDFSSPVKFENSQASLPDIDVDIQAEHREDLINYLRKKYGNDCVSQIVTFSRLKGSGALKEVLRMHEACDFYTSNLITKNMPKEAKVASKMNEDGETSIIMWTLKHQPNVFKDYCQYKDGEFTGEYSEYFKQAIRIEGCIKSTGKHAAGVLISNKPLSETVPMMRDPNSDNLISGMEFGDIDNTGISVKIDVLSIAALTKLQNVNKLLRFGKI